MSQNLLLPRESSEYIVKNAQHVKIKPEGVELLTQEIIKNLLNGNINVNNFSQHELHPKATDAYAIEWIFVVDTLNFCFWTPKYYTKYKVNGYTGYFALCAALNRALDEGLDITNAKFYSELDIKTMESIFRSDDVTTQVPLLAKRLDCLHEVGRILVDKWQGKFENVLKATNNSAVKLLQLIVQEFPCFRDEANYAGKHVSFYKRAQILIGDIWSCFHGQSLADFADINDITMFADYRIPQVLVHFQTLEYSEALMDVLKTDQVLQNGDAMEVEIRGASIYVVEQVKDKIRLLLKEKPAAAFAKCINSILIDHFLWDYRRKHAEELEHIPFHKVLSIYY